MYHLRTPPNFLLLALRCHPAGGKALLLLLALRGKMDETIALQDLTARKETSMFWLNKVNFFDPLLFFFFFFFKSPPLFFDFLFCWCVGAYIECMESTKRVRVVVFSLNISDRKPKKIETSNNQKCWLLLRCYFYNVVRLTRFVITQAGRQT